MDTSDPEITFDESGVCNHCNDYERRVAAEVFRPPLGHQTLAATVAQIKRDGRRKRYDCIVGLSGGVDSTYVAYLTKRLGLRPLRDPACVADWDSTSYDPTAPHCLRRLDNELQYPDDLVGEVHADGEIWSNALWDINLGLGRAKANTLILEAQFSYRPDTSFAQAATVTVTTARELYGQAAANTVKKAFVARKIL